MEKTTIDDHFNGCWDAFYGRYVEITSSSGIQHQARCPFHPDKDPSFSFESLSGKSHCFGCDDADGDGYTFYARQHNLDTKRDFPKVLQGIIDDFSVPEPGKTTAPTTKPPAKKEKKPAPTTPAIPLDDKWSTLYEPRLKTEKYINYLVNKRALERLLVERLFQEQTLLAGTWNNRLAIFLTYRSISGTVTTIQAISIGGALAEDGRTKTFFKDSNIKEDGFFMSGPPLDKATAVIFVESPIDAITTVMAAPKRTSIAIGASGFTGKIKTKLKRLLKNKKVCTFFDKDKAGDDAVIATVLALNRPVYAVTWPADTPERQDVNDLLQQGKTKQIADMLLNSELIKPEDVRNDYIKTKYPRGPFPWKALPESIAKSLQQLARACATSDTSLPGAAMAVFASGIGSRIVVSPKTSWVEPIIIWCMDIRRSGSGKTPASRKLCKRLYIAQTYADKEYEIARNRWDSLQKEDKGLMKEPTRPRGYYATDLTLEGLNADHSEHGGKLILVDELNSIFTGANQYKVKGNDIESWISLHDGQPARIARARGATTLNGAAISVFGGIQPSVWIDTFSSESGKILKTNGMLFRFLPVYEGSGYYPLTTETWAEENREAWESTLDRGMKWADQQESSRNLIFDEEAIQYLIDWRNDLVQLTDDFPEAVRGFIPKIVGYALRFTGVLYLMDVFSRDESLRVSVSSDEALSVPVSSDEALSVPVSSDEALSVPVSSDEALSAPVSIDEALIAPLSIDDVKKGIAVSEFYLGHIIDAMDVLVKEDTDSPFQYTDQVKHLVKVLERIKANVYQDRLSLAFIMKDFNSDCPKGQSIKNPQTMGAVLRRCNLTIPPKPARFQNKSGIKCLTWNKQTDELIDGCP